MDPTQREFRNLFNVCAYILRDIIHLNEFFLIYATYRHVHLTGNDYFCL